MARDDHDDQNDGGRAYKLAATAAAFGASFLARKASTTTWKLAMGSEPPANPEAPDTDFKEAVAWALISGAIIGLARMLANRQAAAMFQKRTGRLPAGAQSAAS